MSLTPKAIAKKIKAKGLQKLRWYCQLCEKQCRDANGFKCHKTSEKHLEMMRLASQNKALVFDRFSKEFESAFMDLVKRRCRTKSVLANKIYNEFIADRNHVHMNATKWESLGGFIAYLGKSAKVEVEETEKGLKIKYIERDPEVLARQQAIAKKDKMAENDEAKVEKLAKKMMKASAGSKVVIPEATELKKDPDQVFALTIAPQPTPSATATTTTTKPNLEATPSLDNSASKPVKKPLVETNVFETLNIKSEKKRERDESDEDTRESKRQRRNDDGKERDKEWDRRESVRDNKRDNRRDREDPRHERDWDKIRDRDGDRDRDSGRDSKYNRERERDWSKARDDRERGRSDRYNDRDRGRNERYDDRDRRRSRSGERDRKERDRGRRGESKSALDEIYANIKKKKEIEEKREQERQAREEEEEKKRAIEGDGKINDFWLHPGIVVKVVHKTLGEGKFYGRKGKIIRVEDQYVGIVKMLDGGEESIKLDQEFLETVIPGVGLTVLVVNGPYLGRQGKLDGIDVDNFKAIVSIDGKKVEKDYEHISKYVGV